MSENLMNERYNKNKIDEFDNKVRAEKDMRVNVHKRIQSSNKQYDEERND